MTHPSRNPAIDEIPLGYDLRSEQTDWYNTPIPRVNRPLPATPELVDIARRIWWNGDPWTILRNRYEFLRAAIDLATPDQCNYLWDLIPREDWINMLQSCYPGQVSTRAWRFWRMQAGLDYINIPDEWHKPLHIRDQVYHQQKTWQERRKAIDPSVA